MTRRKRTSVALDRFSALFRGFADRIQVRGAGECWRWTGAVNSGGYPMVTLNLQRLLWLIENGEIPDQQDLQHCHDRRCCNPTHLSLGRTGAQRRGSHCTRGHELAIVGRNSSGGCSECKRAMNRARQHRTGTPTPGSRKYSFGNFCRTRLKREDAVGDFARDWLADADRPKARRVDLHRIIQHLRLCGATENAIKAARKAWWEYERERSSGGDESLRQAEVEP